MNKKKRIKRFFRGTNTVIVLVALSLIEVRSFQRENELFHIELDRIKAARKIDDLFEKVSEIRLSGEIIGRIYKLCILDNGDLIVVDRNDINIFDSQGQFKSKLGKKGKGPGEYVRPNDVKVDGYSRIYVLDSRNFRVTIYDTTGKYLKSFNIDRFCDQMLVHEKQVYLYSGDFYQSTMAFSYEVSTGKRTLEFAPPTEFLKKLKSNGIPAPFGFVGSLIAISKRKIFVVHPYEYALREFDSEGQELRRRELKSDVFRPIDTSMKFNVSTPIAEFFKSEVRTMVIWKELVFLTIHSNQLKRAFMNVFTLEGKRINEREIAFDEKGVTYAFPFAIDNAGFFYTYYQPDAKDPLNQPNPVIVRYAFAPFRVHK
jgi:hypothetical protein